MLDYCVVNLNDFVCVGGGVDFVFVLWGFGFMVMVLVIMWVCR